MIRRVEYKWLVAIVFVFGLFMNLLDVTIVNVALPTFAHDFGASTTTIQWVVTGYLLSLAVFIPVSGWTGDRFGTKRIFMIALLLFVLGSLLCGFARDIEVLIAFRVLQGVGGGLLTPVGIAMLMRAFPPAERAQAAALIAIPTVVAPASGPVLGGYLVEYQSWHWIFYINVPIGIAGLIAAALFLREEKQPNPGRLDVPGFLLSASGLAFVMYALAEAGPRGFDDGRVMLFGLLGLTLLTAFTIVELRTAQPMIDVRLFGNKLFRASILVQFIGFAGFAGALFILPLLLQAEMGLSPLQSGLTTFPQAIGVAMMVQPVGRLYHRLGPRRMMMVGMAGAAVVTLSFLLVDLETSQWWIRLIMLVRGWFFAFTLVTLPAAAYATISFEDTGRATAIFNTGQQVGSSFGVALLATVLSNRLIYHHSALGVPGTQQSALLAFHEAFIAASVLVALAVALSFFIDDKEAASTMRQAATAPASQEPLAAARTDRPDG